MSTNGKPICNGELVTVLCVLKDGRIHARGNLGQRKTLCADQRMLVPGYAIASYAPQGKTVDTAIVAYSEEWTAANKNQWYVGILRALKAVTRIWRL